MINEETIVSVYNDKMTLLQFLKSVNKALDEAVLTSVEVSKKGNATLSFVFEFADGTKIESGEIVLQQGESVTDAKIVDGHLYLTLSNDERLDAGNVKPVTRFEISASQHLIVYYGDGTSQDLGAILQGNVNIDGTLNATKVTGNEIVETMTGYTMRNGSKAYVTPIYGSVVKNGNKLTIAYSCTINRGENGTGNPDLVWVNIPANIASKLIPWTGSLLEQKDIPFFKTQWTKVNLQVAISKNSNSVYFQVYDIGSLDASTDYYCRIEVTFLLSESLI